VEHAEEQPKFAPPFGEPIYTVAQVAKKFGATTNWVTNMFEKEPGVRDLAEASYFGKKRRMLRIPHSVLERVWNRCDVASPKSSLRRPR
jgi:hypothetical protein